MNNVIGICDRNTVYMKKLAESFMQKSDIPLQIMTFSDDSQLVRYLQEARLEILITDRKAFSDDLNQGHGVAAGSFDRMDGIRQNIRYVLELSDEKGGIERIDEFSFRISRYQSSTDLYHLIKKLITGRQEKYRNSWEYTVGEGKMFSDVEEDGESGVSYGRGFGADRKGGCIIAVYSPVNRCGKTSLAVLMAKILSERSSSLLVCMDHYSRLFSEDEFNLPELVYRMSGENNLRLDEKKIRNFSEYQAFIKEWEGLFYIPASRSVEDMNQISAVQLCRLLDMLKADSTYYYIILDLADGIEDIQKVLETCDFIFMPVLRDCVSACKVEEFNQHMMKIMEQGDWNRLSAKIHRAQLPSVFETERIENYYRELIWSDLFSAADELLRQYEV